MRRAAWAVAVLLLAAGASAFLRRPPLHEGLTFSRAVFDRKGVLLRLTLSEDGKYRLWLPLSEISPLLVEATLLHEDARFRAHLGVDPFSLAAAVYSTYYSRERKRGGSTLTMQLARMKYKINSKNPLGKLRQIASALKLELLYSKEEILEAYLNFAPYGANIEGVGAAALIYFGKNADQLTLSEAVTLSVIPQNPVRRTLTGGNPLDQRTREQARKRLFVRWKKKHPEQAASLDAPWILRSPKDMPFEAPHFVEDLLRSSPEPRIASTLDLGLQKQLELLLKSYVSRNKERGINNAAAIMVDFTSMEVVAAVGSADYFDGAIQGQVSGLSAKRSPGSALKPFTYALAFDQGLVHPLSLVKDAPSAFGSFNPENFDGDFQGPLPAKEALVKSRNVPAVLLSSKLKAPGLYGFLKDAGVEVSKPPEYYGLGLTLGTGETRLEDLARLYAMLGNHGLLKPLRRERGAPQDDGRRLLSPEAVFLVMDGLKANPRPRQAFREDWRAAGTAVYWKTGTSWAFRDAWTAGVFGRYALVVWIGNFNGEGNPSFIGLEAAAPLFFEIVDALHPARDAYAASLERLNVASVEVCAVSGGIPGPRCRHKARAWFIPGVSPIAACDIHREVLVQDGLRSCAGGVPEIYEFWPSDLLRLFRQAGIPRRVPPPYDPACPLAERSYKGEPPRITSPLSGVVYHADMAAPSPIPLSAVADADARDLYWFSDGEALGQSSASKPFFWTPRPGKSVIRVVDDQGRADSREVEVAAAE